MQQVIYTLLNYVNNAIHEDTYYHMARSFLNHIQEIEHCSLEKAALICHVSPATINRFCKQIGYINYSTLRNVCSIKEDHVFKDDLLSSNYMQDYTRAINKNIEAVNHMNMSSLDQALDCLYTQNRCLVLGYGSYQNFALDLQKNLFSCGKFIEVYIDLSKQIEMLSTLGAHDVVLITSIKGIFLDSQKIKQIQLLRQKGCKVILITQREDKDFLSHFDYVLTCGDKNYNEAVKYAIIRLYDLMAYRYRQLYRPIIKE